MGARCMYFCKVYILHLWVLQAEAFCFILITCLDYLLVELGGQHSGEQGRRIHETVFEDIVQGDECRWLLLVHLERRGVAHSWESSQQTCKEPRIWPSYQNHQQCNQCQMSALSSSTRSSGLCLPKPCRDWLPPPPEFLYSFDHVLPHCPEFEPMAAQLISCKLQVLVHNAKLLKRCRVLLSLQCKPKMLICT